MAIKEKEMSETILPILLKLNGVVYKFIVKGNDWHWMSDIKHACDLLGNVLRYTVFASHDCNVSGQ
jgi:hypothetical protein